MNSDIVNEIDPYQELVKERSPYLFCDNCQYYPIEPVQGHFVCPSCHMRTSCCDGAPMEMRDEMGDKTGGLGAT